VRADEAVIGDMYSPVEERTRELGPGNAQPAVVGNEVDVMTNGNFAADRDEVRLAAKGEQAGAEDLYLFAYLGSLTAKVSDRILMQPDSIRHQSKRPPNHELPPRRNSAAGERHMSAVMSTISSPVVIVG
jgi:hypothetical protein